MVESAEGAQTPLERRLELLGRRLVWLTLGVAVVVIGVGLIAGRDTMLMIQTGIALAVAAIPEGLPIVATIALVHGMQRMLRRKALMRRLSSVELIGPKADVFTGKHGVPATADLGIMEMKPELYDALIIPGGYSPDHMRREPKMAETVRQMVEAGKVVAAICHGPWMLASAKVLEGRTVTSFFSIQDDLENAGAQWVNKEVVRDGNLITSRTPADLPAFCRTIIGAIRES